MQTNKTGVRSVDELYGISFTGNIIPQSWYGAIQMEDGKPDLAAITILGEILYWHRPREECSDDEAVGITLKKKFKADLLQMSYSQIKDKFSITKDMSRRALEKLETLGLIKRHFRTVVTESGNKLGNVMYIELFTQKLLEITFPEGEIDPCGLKSTRVSDQTDKVIGYSQIAHGPEPTTNTENTTEITNIDYNSIYQAEVERVRNQVDYEILTGDKKADRGMIDEMIGIIADMNLYAKEPQSINGDRIPASIVRERLRKVNGHVMEEVLSSMRSAPRGVINTRGYFLTALFNAASTYDIGLDMEVSRDMFRKEACIWEA